MSMHQDHRPLLDGETLEESRERVLATARPFPPYEDMVIDDLTDDEEAQFLAAISAE
ncbi:MAG: hypothetical protein AB7Q42_22750 [Acidimicrobiia bacterium]